MSRAKRSKQIGKLPPFVAVTWEILNSQAYKKLSPSAGKALPYFLGKHGKLYYKDGEQYDATFIFSYGDARNMGFASRTFSRIITDLVAKGFVELAGYGGMRGFCNSHNKFKISNRWRQYGQQSFVPLKRYPSEP